MKIETRDLSINHPLVKAAHMMVITHANNNTMIPAINEVSINFPTLSQESLMILWIGINAADLDS